MKAEDKFVLYYIEENRMTHLQYTLQCTLNCYRFSRSQAEEASVRPVSWAVFWTFFHKKKLAVHKLKKDSCESCEDFLHKRTTEEEHLLHRLMVTEARKEKQNDKNRKDDNFMMLIVDLQKVMQCPHLFVGLQYYLTKLQLRNYTIFKPQTKDVVCKLWEESQGGVDASCFASLLSSHIETAVEECPNLVEVVVWSDGCAAQNRNSTLSNVLEDLAKRLCITIIQKYFVKGHSQNEADSVHARIEQSLKKTKVYSVDGYVALIESARKTNDGKTKPYQVQRVTYTDFQDYSNVKYYKSIRPGTEIGADTVNMLKAIKYSPEGPIQYKLRFSEPWRDIPAEHKYQRATRRICRKYDAPLPITKSKYKDLQRLKKFIPDCHHPYYDSLSYRDQ